MLFSKRAHILKRLSAGGQAVFALCFTSVLSQNYPRKSLSEQTKLLQEYSDFTDSSFTVLR